MIQSHISSKTVCIDLYSIYNLYEFLNIYCPRIEMVCADIIGLCAILQLGIRDYCLLREHVHIPGPTGLAAVTLIWVTVQ